RLQVGSVVLGASAGLLFIAVFIFAQFSASFTTTGELSPTFACRYFTDCLWGFCLHGDWQPGLAIARPRPSRTQLLCAHHNRLIFIALLAALSALFRERPVNEQWVRRCGEKPDPKI